MKAQTLKRIESFTWRISMMALAFGLDMAIKKLWMLNINPEYVVVIGLILGEVSKAIKNEYDFRQEVKEISEM